MRRQTSKQLTTVQVHNTDGPQCALSTYNVPHYKNIHLPIHREAYEAVPCNDHLYEAKTPNKNWTHGIML
jgi:hypothetical protein